MQSRKIHLKKLALPYNSLDKYNNFTGCNWRDPFDLFNVLFWYSGRKDWLSPRKLIILKIKKGVEYINIYQPYKIFENMMWYEVKLQIGIQVGKGSTCFIYTISTTKICVVSDIYTTILFIRTTNTKWNETHYINSFNKKNTSRLS